MAVRRRAGSPFFFYDFTIGGRRHRGSTGKKTKAEAVAEESRLRIAAETAKAQENDWRMRHLAGTYLANVAKGKSSERVLTYQVDYLVDGFGKDKRINELTNADVARYVARRRAKVAGSTINRELTILRAMLNYAKNAWDHTTPKINWASHWRQEPPARDRFLSREEYERLLSVAHEDLRPIIIFAVTTGLRRENILRLQWSEIDLEAKVLRVKVKGNKRHVVELRGDAFTVLAAMPHRKGPVFETTGFRNRWDRAVEDAGLTDTRFHDLRHTFASWALLAGASLVAIKDALAHSDISVTTRYAHIRPGHNQSAFDYVAAQNLSHTKTKILK